MAHETFLESEPVFTRPDLAAYLEDRGVAYPHAYSRQLQERWQKEGRVVAVRPDLCAVIPAGAPPTGFYPWPYLVATKLAPDAVLSHRSAVEYWGFSYTMWYETVYSATRPAPETVNGSMRYRGHPFPDRLVQLGGQHFGVVELDYLGGRVRVTAVERTLVDVLGAPHLGGSWDEIWRMLALADAYDLDTVAAYCDLLGAGSALRAKTGFFLDHHRHLWGFDDDDLAPFRPPPRREPYYLDPDTPRPFLLVEDWNLVVPTYIWKRGWEAFH